MRGPAPAAEVTIRTVPVRLAGGVVAGRGLRAWASGAAGGCLDAAAVELPAGAPVAVGPAAAGEVAAARALAELAELVAAAGLVVPSAWLGPGGWAALWARAARTTAAAARTG
jgi:hypothetical protein